PFVRNELREKILKIADEMGYNPKQSARTDTLAIIVGDLGTRDYMRYEALVVNELCHELVQQGIYFQIISISELAYLHANFIDSCIAVLSSDENIAKLRKIRKLPLIGINILDEATHAVYSDDHKGGLLATEYLLTHGHRRIGCLLSPGPASISAKMRSEGYRSALENFGVPYDAELIQRSFLKDVSENIQYLIDRGVTAIFAGNEHLAVSVMSNLQYSGIRIPDDISVVGYENSAISSYLYPAQTNVAQDFTQMAKIAIEQLQHTIKRYNTPLLRICVSPYLIERESVRTI
ncbi:MAG: LacI family DNA-binding transcriptional regulator, partial [Planctomycetes bacterium]|nr:LacI family DNA-binding transcriptional regulator [Planctomycetota bacterium]